MPTLKLDATRLDRAGAAVYETLKGPYAAADLPWSDLKRRAGYSSAEFSQMNDCLQIARKVLEAYADRGGARWLR